MTRPATSRSASSGRPILKTSNPSALKLSSKGHPAAKTSPPLSKGRTKRHSRSASSDDDWSDDMNALPNFCTTCEKQIINPHSTILYCSEACRRKDAASTTEAAIETGVPSPPMTRQTSEEEPLFDIVAQQSPTVLRPASMISADSFAEDSHESDAAKYLSQFRTPGSSPTGRAYQGYQRNSSHTALPSLSHTPNSLASPWSSYSSISRTAPSKVSGFGYRSANTRAFDFGMPSSMNNADVLRTKASTETAFRVTDGEITYEKRSMATSPGGSPAPGSLKQLFAHEAMRRPSLLTSNTSSSSLSRMRSADEE